MFALLDVPRSCHSSAPGLLRRMTDAGGNAVLMYHGVSPTASRRFREFVVAPSRFEEQMAYLAESGFRGCTLSELLELRRLGKPTGDAVAITFDDAFQELLTHAIPVLHRFGFGATIFVPTAYIGGSSSWLGRIGEGDRRLLTAEELHGLASTGVELGAHSHTHAALDVLPREAARTEVELSKRVLEETIGREVASFAYPFGYESTAVRRLVAGAGYASACRVGYAVSPANEDVYGLSRLPVAGNVGLESFAALVEGQLSLRGKRVLSHAWRPLRRGISRIKGYGGHVAS
jgi:peptidoglycan/xylan/chitin deacetylase (PgdA/CDA1 family)